MKLRDLNRQLDRIAALVVALLSIAVIFYGLTAPLNHITYLIVGALALVSSFIWLRVRDWGTLAQIDPPSNHNLFLAGNVLFFFFLGCAILALRLRPSVYVRPIEFFVFVALLASALALEILTCDSKPRGLSLILAQIVILGCTVQFSQLVIFPNVIGIDPWYHQLFAAQTISLSHVPAASPIGNYARLPIFDLQVVSASLLASVDYKLAVMLAIEIPQVILAALLVFLLGKALINAKAGLLGGLMLVVATIFIQMGVRTIPNTFGGILFLVGVYVLWKARDKNATRHLLILLPILLTLILEHTVSALAMAIALVFALVGVFVYRTLFRRDPDIPLSIAVTITYIIGMLAWWTYVFGDFRAVLRRLEPASFLRTGAPGGVIAISQPAWQQVLSYSPFVICFAALLGCFYMISKRFGSPKTFILVLIAVPFLVLAASGVGDLYLFQERWIYFAQILFALPLGVTLLIVYRLIRGAAARSFFLVAAVALLALVMVVSPGANSDNTLGSSS